MSYSLAIAYGIILRIKAGNGKRFSAVENSLHDSHHIVWG